VSWYVGGGSFVSFLVGGAVGVVGSLACPLGSRPAGNALIPCVFIRRYHYQGRDDAVLLTRQTIRRLFETAAIIVL
jgi:hypothetical protein